jgi:hypothetical protein
VRSACGLGLRRALEARVAGERPEVDRRGGQRLEEAPAHRPSLFLRRNGGWRSVDRPVPLRAAIARRLRETPPSLDRIEAVLRERR